MTGTASRAATRASDPSRMTAGRRLLGRATLEVVGRPVLRGDLVEGRHQGARDGPPADVDLQGVLEHSGRGFRRAGEELGGEHRERVAVLLSRPAAAVALDGTEARRAGRARPGRRGGRRPSRPAGRRGRGRCRETASSVAATSCRAHRTAAAGSAETAARSARLRSGRSPVTSVGVGETGSSSHAAASRGVAEGSMRRSSLRSRRKRVAAVGGDHEMGHSGHAFERALPVRTTVCADAGSCSGD